MVVVVEYVCKSGLSYRGGGGGAVEEVGVDAMGGEWRRSF